MRYALIREMDISNGRGVGVSLFVQGCHFHCKGCFNQETWDFNGGKLWDRKIRDQFIDLVNRPYIKRVSILGGEPMADENVGSVLSLVMDIRDKFPDKEIWVYTGYVLEDLMHITRESDENDITRYIMLYYIDYLVDGRFDINKQDTMHKEIVFAGSTNQRVIAMKDVNLGGILGKYLPQITTQS